MSMGRKQGESVTFTYEGGSSGTATLYDASRNVRTLQSWEQLILDSITAVVEDGGGISGVYYLADSNANTVPVIAFFGEAAAAAAQGHPASFSEFPGEGISLSVAGLPYISGFANGALVTGTARIINGKSQGTRPIYQCLLTPGGNIGGQ